MSAGGLILTIVCAVAWTVGAALGGLIAWTAYAWCWTAVAWAAVAWMTGRTP
jgi:hypothetical protein